MLIYGFEEKDAHRIKRSVRRFEGYYQNRPPSRPRYPVAGGSGLIPASITSNVTAGSEATPTSFTATVEVPSGTHGFTTTGGTSVTAYNRAPGVAFTASSGSPKVGWLTVVNGTFYLAGADC